MKGNKNSTNNLSEGNIFVECVIPEFLPILLHDKFAEITNSELTFMHSIATERDCDDRNALHLLVYHCGLLPITNEMKALCAVLVHYNPNLLKHRDIYDELPINYLSDNFFSSFVSHEMRSQLGEFFIGHNAGKFVSLPENLKWHAEATANLMHNNRPQQIQSSASLEVVTSALITTSTSLALKF